MRSSKRSNRSRSSILTDSGGSAVSSSVKPSLVGGIQRGLGDQASGCIPVVYSDTNSSVKGRKEFIVYSWAFLVNIKGCRFPQSCQPVSEHEAEGWNSMES